jgi:hypothetical protein
MIEKIEIDEGKRRRIIDKAGHLADELALKYYACAPGTFAGVCDAFRSEDIELFSPETQEVLTRGMVGLQGGVGITGVGTCGAVSASAFIISYVTGITTEELAKNINLNYAIAIPVVEYIVDRFEETYGAIDCLRLRYNRVQRAFDRCDPDGKLWETLFAMYEKEKCGVLAPDFEGGRDQVPVVQGARWAAEAVCDLLGMEPEERKEMPPYVQDLDPKIMEPKLKKVVEALKELDFGRPHEKLSYRDYWAFKLKGKKGVEEGRLGSVSAPKEEYGTSEEKSEG